jgi:hypothetical protein
MKIEISYNNRELYDSVLIFLDRLCGLKSNSKQLTSVYTTNNYISSSKKDNTVLVPVLSNRKMYECEYNGVKILIFEEKSEKNYVLFRSKHVLPQKVLHIEMKTESEEFFSSVFEDIHKYLENGCKTIECDHISHYVFTDYHEWIKNDQYYKRNQDTLYLPKDVKENLIEDVDNFYYNSEISNFYKVLNIPQSRVYLFYGYPGTGKTTTSCVIASKLNLDICTLDFTNNIDDAVFRKSMKRLPENSIFLIEDIDHLFSPQKTNDEHRHSITFSGLLNILDGISKVKKLICIITCNNIDVLDKTLLRRIDYSVEFKKGVTEEQLSSFAKELPLNMDTNKFVRFFKSKDTTINVIQKWILINLNRLIEKKVEISDILNEFIDFNKWYQVSSNKGNLYN